MLNYRLISINLGIILSVTILYVFIRIHVESFNVVYMSHVMEKPVCVIIIHDNGLTFGPPAHCIVWLSTWRKLCYKCLVIRLTHAQCLVITEDGEQGYSKTMPIF